MDRIENTIPNNTPIVVRVFTDPLIRNGLHNPFFLLLRVCMLRALPGNGRRPQSHRSETCLYASVLIVSPFWIVQLKFTREQHVLSEELTPPKGWIGTA
jgi:hypothetical protein